MINPRAFPEVISGYDLNPKRGFFSVILPIARTNLITNPSFETNSTGYTLVDGATLTRTTETQRRGAYCARIKPGASAVSGVYYSTSALVAGNTYAFSVDVFIRGGVDFQIRAFDGIRSLVTKPVTGKGYWERVSFVFTAVTSGVHRLYLEKNGESSNTNTDNFFTDGWQLELCEAGNYWPTTYIDGDLTGLVVNQQPPAFIWNGTPHASTSTRSGQTRAGGQVVKLLDLGLRVLAMIGVGMGQLNNTSINYGLIDGGQYQRTIAVPKNFTLTGSITGGTLAQVQRSQQALIDAFKPDVTGLQQLLILRYQYADGCGSEAGEVLEIPCVYSSGLSSNTDNLNQERLALQFTAYDPYWRGEGNAGIRLSYAEPLNVVGAMERSPAGVWNYLNGGVVGTVYDSVYGPDGMLYIGGSFQFAYNGSGLANIPVNRIARWTGTEWQVLGGGVNDVVRAIAFAPNGDLYITGDFTSTGSGAANRIAKFNFTTSTWSALGTGLNGVGRALQFDKLGDLFVGGDFTLANAVANTSRIARYRPSSGAWSALSTGANGVVRALAVDKNNNLFLGGDFTLAGGVANTLLIAMWDSLVFTPLSTGIEPFGVQVNALEFDNSANLYIGGDFNSGGGVQSPNLVRWNGTSYSKVLFGIGSPVFDLEYSLNRLWIAGGGGSYFANASGDTKDLPTSAAAWNNSTFLPISFDDRTSGFSPSSSNSIALAANGRLFVGAVITIPPAEPAAVTVVNNRGKAKASPIIKFTGPGTPYQLINFTTGDEIYFNGLTLLANETAILDLTPGKISFTSNLRGNLLGFVVPTSELAIFGLQPGNNNISLQIIASSSATEAVMTWRERQWSASGSIR